MCLFQSVKFTMLHMEQVNSVLCMNYPMLETQHMFCYGQAVQKLKLNGEAQAYCGEIVSPYVALISTCPRSVVTCTCFKSSMYYLHVALKNTFTTNTHKVHVVVGWSLQLGASHLFCLDHDSHILPVHYILRKRND